MNDPVPLHFRPRIIRTDTGRRTGHLKMVLDTLRPPVAIDHANAGASIRGEET